MAESPRVCEFIRACQSFAGESSLTSDKHAQTSLVRGFVSRLPDPGDRLESVIFRGLLVEVALKWARHVHGRAPRTQSLQCQFPAPEDLSVYWNGGLSGYKSLFERWAIAFLEELDTAYPISAAGRAKAIIDKRFAEALSLKHLARMSGCTPVRLRTSFKRQFGLSLREYRTRARALSAARLIAGSDVKVEAIATLSGFRSRRNFYSAFKRFMGCTPSEMRRTTHQGDTPSRQTGSKRQRLIASAMDPI